MKNPFRSRPAGFDAQAIQQKIQRALAAAGLSSGAAPLRGVADTLRRAWAAGGPAASVPPGDATAGAEPAARAGAVVRSADAPVAGRDAAPGSATANPAQAGQAAQTAGSWHTHQFTNPAGSRTYKLYVPPGLPPGPAAAPAMVVMLHGCTQSADDFAAGTQMQRWADQHGLLVVYPEQPSQANPSKCWNWFKPQDQVRDAGEPSLIAGIVRQVAQRHGADPRRIFAAGLSAGAAMALVLGETYPDLFAGIGVHSGLPYGSAHDIPSALAAMKGGRSGLPGLGGTSGISGMHGLSGLSGLNGVNGLSALSALSGVSAKSPGQAVHAVPLIVFHGDRDHTVQPSNAAEIVRQAAAAHAQAAGVALTSDTRHGQAPGGRSYSRTVHADAQGRALIESWSLQGGGHAWSGGDARGSYTDATGPDASAEMVRFFLALPVA